MLGAVIDDPVESDPPQIVAGLGLLAADTVFEPDKVTRWRTGQALTQPVRGYQIHHGRTHSTAPWIALVDPTDHDGAQANDGQVLGTTLHGLLEADGFRSAFLAGVAQRAGRPWAPSGVSFPAAREARFDRLADLLETHLDLAGIERLIRIADPVTTRRP
jgi:adenosylcobyric acid synthase